MYGLQAGTRQLLVATMDKQTTLSYSHKRR
jgi:hypothetical protein